MKLKVVVAIIAVILLSFLLLTLTFSLLTPQTTIPTKGTIKTVGLTAWQDAACTVPLTEIDWGVVELGSATMRTVYLKSVGNADVTLSLTTSNYTPPIASSFLSVTWNGEGAVLPANSTYTAEFTLNVSDAVVGVTNFSFDITITGTG